MRYKVCGGGGAELSINVPRKSLGLQTYMYVLVFAANNTYNVIIV